MTTLRHWRVGHKALSPIRAARSLHSTSVFRGKNRVYESSVRNEDELTSLLLVSASSGQPLVTLWTASWCPSCKAVAPMLRKAVEDGVGQAEGGVAFVEVEADAQDMGEMPMRYGVGSSYGQTFQLLTHSQITSIPTLLAFSRQEAQTGTKVTNVKDLKDQAFMKDWLVTEASRGGKGGSGGSGFLGFFGR
ncbi:MAG: hypothetical protein M1814_005269 [Vezdaea aestivalis]|nr:MAG: hypothetical protein M1814_005269 [Vezdaea aestivalis]